MPRSAKINKASDNFMLFIIDEFGNFLLCNLLKRMGIYSRWVEWIFQKERVKNSSCIESSLATASSAGRNIEGNLAFILGFSLSLNLTN